MSKIEIEINLPTTAIKADENVTAAQVATAIVQTALVKKETDKVVLEEQSRLVWVFAIAAGLKEKPEKNACGKGSIWAVARAAISKEIMAQADGLGVGYKTQETCDRGANRALNAAGFISREKKSKKDWEKRIVENTMQQVATRDKDGVVIECDLDDVVTYLGGFETDAGKAAVKYFDDLADKRFGLTEDVEEEETVTA